MCGERIKQHHSERGETRVEKANIGAQMQAVDEKASFPYLSRANLNLGPYLLLKNNGRTEEPYKSKSLLRYAEAPTSNRLSSPSIPDTETEKLETVPNSQSLEYQTTRHLAKVNATCQRITGPLYGREDGLAGVKSISDENTKYLVTPANNSAFIPTTLESWGWLPALSLICGIGLLLLALEYNAARTALDWSQPIFWLGLLVLFLPIAGRLLSGKPSRRECIGLIIILGFSLYLTKFLQYPLYYTNHDEFSHWRTALDITASGHLFGENPLLPISSYYPGLEIVVSAVSNLTGLSLFSSGIIVIGVNRLVLVLALYLFFELISRSTRIAGIATLLYMANPQFLFFDAQFSYESLALPLAAFVLFALALRCYTPSRRQRGLTLIICLGLGAVTITHHITSFALAAFLFLWTAVYLFQNRRLKGVVGSSPAFAALLGLAFCMIWLVFTGDIVLGYLSPHLGGALTQVQQIINSEAAPRQLFQDGATYSAPAWERIVAFASLILIMLGFPPGLLLVWQKFRANTAASALAVVALLFPISQLLRLTSYGAESAVRATEFLFLGIAFVLALVAVQLRSSLVPSWRRPVIFMVMLAILVIGQVISGSVPSWARLPGSYLVSADQRSIEPEGITAAEWVGSYLESGQQFGSDRINTLLMATYGNEIASTSLTEKTPVDDLFTALQFGPNERAILQQDGLQYLVVDHRLTTSLPWVGFYFNSSVSGVQLSNRPIDPEALAKFDTIDNVSRIFDSGDIIIYDVKDLTNQEINTRSKTSCVPSPSTAKSPVYPIVAKHYNGTTRDIPTNITTSISLTDIQQLQGSICGYFSGKTANALYNKIPANSPFTGSITATKQIQIIVTINSGQTSFDFDGFIRPNGNISGTYCGHGSNIKKCSYYGPWSVSPATG